MVLVALFLTLAFTVVATSYAQLSVSRRITNRTHARNLAESALAAGMDRLLKDPQFGADQEHQSTIRISPLGKGTAILSFNRAAAQSLNVPYSTNNLQGDSAVPGSDNRVVPAQAARLVAVGDRSGVSVTMEAVLHVPRFPYAIACSGPFQSQGQLLVASVDQISDLAAGVENVTPKELKPGHLDSNARSSDALTVGPDALVTGDLRSSGGVDVAPGARVEGEIRPYQNPLALPRINVTDYDPDKLGLHNVQHLTSQFLYKPVLGGYLRSSGNLSIQGGATLDGAVLYVDGNLSVDGPIDGQGALFVTGTTQLIGGGAVKSDNLAALVSQGDVLLEGNGQTGSYFQGLVYTEGNFTARDLTLVGVFVANSSTGGGAFSTKDVSVVHLGAYSKIAFPVGSNSVAFYFDPVTGAFRGIDPKLAQGNSRTAPIELVLTRDSSGFRVTTAGGSVLVDGLQTVQAVVNAFGSKVSGLATSYTGLGPSGTQQIQSLVRAHFPGSVANASGGVPQQMFSLDINRFLSLSDRARLLYWRELGGGDPIAGR